MAERKVLNKYFPPDFDPAKIPRLRLGKNRQIKVRLMSPFSMRCETCGQWIGKGTKFNARKEPIEGEKFHSIQIYRFYIRCQRCAAEITFKTDPEKLNYEVEKGAQRNFEPWREENQINRELKKAKEEEEENNPIKVLENRTEQSRREMEIMDALDEIRMQNAKGERVHDKEVLQAVRERNVEEEERKRKIEEEEDERMAQMVFGSVGGRRIKRVREEDAVDRELEIKTTALSVRNSGSQIVEGQASAGHSRFSRALLGIKNVKAKSAESSMEKESGTGKQNVNREEQSTTTLAGMLGAYGDGDSSSDDESDSD
ncbi:Pre-mRNA-splicing factor cwf16 [Coemansia sp. IMI 203386]|nr:Pre-mRNA-splicing factor cwf16 [Coemansia sp. IMI 203386]